MATNGANQPNREELFRMAVNAAKQGNAEGARVMFNQILQEDKKHDRAMIWMAKLSRSKDERTRWLNRVLEIDPENEQAKSALAKMDYRERATQNRTLFIVGGIAVFVVIVIFIIIAAFALVPR
jgi:Tfp pilus assembly protein PilF